MKIKLIALYCVFLCAAVCAAEEDPSYEPSSRPRPTPPPKKAISLTEALAPSTTPADQPAKSQPSKTTRAKSPPVEVAPEPVYVPPAEPRVVQPAGPRVKYILNGKPVYEGDPDPIAEAAAKGKTSQPTTNVYFAKVKSGETGFSVPPAVVTPPATPQPPVAAPRNAYAPDSNSPSVRLDFASTYPRPDARAAALIVRPAAETVSGERKVKYILDGKPVYEGDPDPVLAKPGTSSSVGAASNDYSAAAMLARQQKAATSAALIDDVTADKPSAAGKAASQANGQLVLETIVAPGPVNSRAKKCYASLGELKKQIEAISRHLDNRGRENAALLHTSDAVLDEINNLAAIWPKSEAYIDVCTVAKRSALVFNNDLNEVPWTWTHVRWSFDALVKDVRALRSYAKTMAEAEPPPQMIVGKDGSVVYIDAPDQAVDELTARREAMQKAARADIQRIKEQNAEREARRKNSMPLDLDTKSKSQD